MGWRDTVLKELERKHSKERDILLDLLQEGDSEDFREEARTMSVDERNKRLATLREKRNQLDLSLQGRFFTLVALDRKFLLLLNQTFEIFL